MMVVLLMMMMQTRMMELRMHMEIMTSNIDGAATQMVIILVMMANVEYIWASSTVYDVFWNLHF